MQLPTYGSKPKSMFEIESPGFAGINLEDLEFNQTSNQSPSMINMMYRNGVFGKRYGQAFRGDGVEEEIIATGFYKSSVIFHAGSKLYRFTKETDVYEELFDGLSAVAGVFFNFNRNLYYMSDKYYFFNGNEFKEVEPYAPDVCINRKPDGTYSDLIENYNRLGKAFKNTFNADGTSKVYVLTQKALDDNSKVVCEINGKLLDSTAYKVDYVEGKISFNLAPTTGQNNVVITAEKTEKEYIESIISCKYFTAYGGSNNSRIFAAGNGNSIYYFSDVFDATYFPENNYGSLGNGESDITGFGEQFDRLIIFKPNEMYSVGYSITSDAKAIFPVITINPKIGCDVPGSIQLLKNGLTWISTIYGVCTLVSTDVENEKNVQSISRNINGGYRKKGLLQEENLHRATSVNWDGKYMVSVNGNCYMWDYEVTPYSFTGNTDMDSMRLAWFIFDNFHVGQFIVDDRDLFYSKSNKLVEINDTYLDFGEAINAHYQTPLISFQQENMLKTIHNLYVQARGDTPSKINIKYINEDNAEGEIEPEAIHVPGKMWSLFDWNIYDWYAINFAKTFARKCAIKKVEAISFLFSNSEVGSDMSISDIKIMYSTVKRIK